MGPGCILVVPEVTGLFHGSIDGTCRGLGMFGHSQCKVESLFSPARP